MKKYIFCFLSLTLLSVFSCSEEEKEVVLEIPPEPVSQIDLHSIWVDSVYETLSLEEQVGQLIWLETGSLNDSILEFQNEFPVGAIVSNSEKHAYFQFFEKLDPMRTPLLMGTSKWNLPYYFEGNNWSDKEFSASQNQAFLSEIYDSNANYLADLNQHLIFHYTDTILRDNLSRLNGFQSRLDSGYRRFKDENILSVLLSIDSNSQNKYLKNIIKSSKVIINFDKDITEKTINEEQLLINGSSFTIAENQYDTIINILSKGEEFVFLRGVNALAFKKIREMIGLAVLDDKFNVKVIETNVRKILALKEWLGLVKTFNKIERNFDKKHVISLRSQQYKLKYLGQVLVKNDKKLLPLKDWNNKYFKWIKIGKKKLKYFTKAVFDYADITNSTTTVKNLAINHYKKSNPLIIVLNEELDSTSGELFTDKVGLYANKQKIIVVNFGNEENLQYLASLPCLLQVWNSDEYSQQLAAQAIFGGNEISGQLPFTIGRFKQGCGLKTKKTRLAYAIPEAAGFHRDSLKKVDKIAREAVYSKVTPGCQIFAARNGKVIYHKTFGYHTYERNLLVQKQDVYDIASVTKIASTTICGMKMYDQGFYKMSDSLKNHLPDSLTKTLGYKSRLSNVTFKELFTHTSGLPSGLPIYKFIAYVDSVIGKFDRYYCDETDGYYCVEVARDFYLDSAYLDSLWISMNRILPGEKKYKYSDANMNMLYQLFRSKLKKVSYDRYMAREFYSPLKLRTTGYLPLQYLDTLKHRITPTEYDTYWRYQLLKGYVHDPNAALYGGVAGNAGIFSNANDLGVLFQMVMNNGAYGGKQYLSPQTIKRFTSHQQGSHRGIGFDKPTYQSVSTVAPDCPTTAFGHTGFTGICVWADSENDLLFIFVSNRVYPDPANKKIITYGIRKRLHQVFYDQLKYSGLYKNEKHPEGYIPKPNRKSDN